MTEETANNEHSGSPACSLGSYWLVTVQAGTMVHTIAIDGSPAMWLAKWGCHFEPLILFAMPISVAEYEAMNAVRS